MEQNSNIDADKCSYKNRFLSEYKDIILSKITKEYWYKQFQSEQKPTTNIEQALINLEEYFDDRSDINKWNNPNPEMQLLNDVLVIKKYFGLG